MNAAKKNCISAEPLVNNAPDAERLKAMAAPYVDKNHSMTSADERRERQTQSEKLIQLCNDLELFKAPDGEAFAMLPVNGHSENWSLNSRAFNLRIKQRFFEATGKAANAQAVSDAIDHLTARAIFGTKDQPPNEKSVNLRVAQHEGKIYIDLCNPDWQVVEICVTGWRVIEEGPVKFIRRAGMKELPTPQSGGYLDELRNFINCSERDWVLTIAWLLAACSPRGPYPILEVGGEQGSAKSTFCKVIKELTDPNRAPLNSPPKDEGQVAVHSRSEWVICYDNMSGLPSGISDVFCRMSTGGAYKTRKLYTDADSEILEIQRPLLLNGIEDIARNGDLVERTLKVFLPAIKDGRRKDERGFWKDFQAAKPKILGALFDVIASALANLDSVKLEKLPRLADFAIWVAAAEPGLGWEPGTFERAYLDHLKDASTNNLEGDDLAQAVISLMASRSEFQSTTTELLTRLASLADEGATKSRRWPTKQTLKGKLTRLAPALKVVGIRYEFDRDREGSRHIFCKL